MDFKVYNIANRDDQFVELLEPLTLNDVDVKVNIPKYYSLDKDVIGHLHVKLKDEVAQKLRVFLKDYSDKEYIERQERYMEEHPADDRTQHINGRLEGLVIGQYTGGLTRTYKKHIDFRGIRKQDTKEAKIQSETMTLAGKMLLEQKVKVNQMIEEFNHKLNDKIEYQNRNYLQYMKSLYSGSNVTENWKKENLDDETVNKVIDNIDEQIAELREQRKEAVEKQIAVRNRNMYLYLEGIEWGADTDEDWGHDPIPAFLRAEYEELYKEGKGFQIEDKFKLEFE